MLAEYVHCLTPAMCTSRVETLLPASSDNVLPTLRMRRLSASPDHWVRHIAISTALTTQAPTHNLFASPNATNAPRSVQQPYCTSTLPSPPHPRSLPHTRNPQVCMYVCAIIHSASYILTATHSALYSHHFHASFHAYPSIHPSLSIHLSIPYNSLGHPCMYIRTHTCTRQLTRPSTRLSHRLPLTG